MPEEGEHTGGAAGRDTSSDDVAPAAVVQQQQQRQQLVLPSSPAVETAGDDGNTRNTTTTTRSTSSPRPLSPMSVSHATSRTRVRVHHQHHHQHREGFGRLQEEMENAEEMLAQILPNADSMQEQESISEAVTAASTSSSSGNDSDVDYRAAQREEAADSVVRLDKSLLKGRHRVRSIAWRSFLKSSELGLTASSLGSPAASPSAVSIRSNNFMRENRWLTSDDTVAARFPEARVAAYGQAALLRKANAVTTPPLSPQEDSPFEQNDGAVDPQAVLVPWSTQYVRVAVVAHIVFIALYLHYRIQKTIQPDDVFFFDVEWLPVRPWSWSFLAVEIWLSFHALFSHTTRVFGVWRPRVRIDSLISTDPNVGCNCRAAILLPTAGERLDIVLKALMGAVGQNLWASGRPAKDTLRIIVLDEKKRESVLQLCVAVYVLGKLVRLPSIIQVMQIEGCQDLTVTKLFDWYTREGFARYLLYNCQGLERACHILAVLDFIARTSQHPSEAPDLLVSTESMNVFGTMLENYGVKDAPLQPGHLTTLCDSEAIPTVIYYTRKEPGTPRQSPKSGNMNSALFAVDYPDCAPLIGDSTLVAINDARHELYPEFLQRTMPFFFRLEQDCVGDETIVPSYAWDDVCLVQTPQKFSLGSLEDDPLGNHATMGFDVANAGKDGVQAVSSCGHGSVWRVAALYGAGPSGEKLVEELNPEAIGHQVGYVAELLVEDTHTSNHLFRRGWTSRYVNVPGEDLSMCTHQPNTLFWRTKQLLRWHQGAAQLLLQKGVSWAMFGNNRMRSIWHRLYCVDQMIYILGGFPGLMLIIMPVVYGVGGQPPLRPEPVPFFLYFTPYIVLGQLVTILAAWGARADTQKFVRDEQTWLSTTYLQAYAFYSIVVGGIASCLGKGSQDAWNVSPPIWPLLVGFFAQPIAIGFAFLWYTLGKWGFTTFDLAAVCISSLMTLHGLWPMVALHMDYHKHVPSVYVLKAIMYAVVGVLIVLVGGARSDWQDLSASMIW
jgi:cellulose synthase/poly-beta-1,6-N-acetylglucosamine synthase-like glycosyltransferase